MAKKEEVAKKPSSKYGVSHLAEELDIQPASVRVALRNNNVKKNKEGVYGWDNQSDFKAVVSKLKGGSAKKEAPTKKSAPAKKSSKKSEE